MNEEEDEGRKGWSGMNGTGGHCCIALKYIYFLINESQQCYQS